MHIHYLQHVPFEGLGSIHTWALQHAHQVSVSRLYEQTRFPDQEQFDWLIVMGGPMSVYEERQYPWLIPEKRFIETCISSGKVVIGICLGAQLIADVLGANVYANQHKEIGWLPIHFTDDARHLPLFRDIPSPLTVFHWHGDTFDLPGNALHIARSEACINQAFLAHNRVLGLQFHLEMTQHNVQQLVNACQDELVDAPFIQNRETILAKEIQCQRINEMMWRLLDQFECCSP